MDAIILPVALAATAACALVNFWLALRVGQVRRAEKVSVGDGGNPRLIARMRAQLNFVEYTPFILILIALIELAIGTQWWLAAVAGLYVVARVLHAPGMDGWKAGRAIGTVVTMLTLIGLAGVAVTIPYFSFGSVETIEIVEVPA